MILFGTIAMRFGYLLHTLQDHYVPEIGNTLNINCICTRTMSKKKSEIFSIPIAEGQYL